MSAKTTTLYTTSYPQCCCTGTNEDCLEIERDVFGVLTMQCFCFQIKIKRVWCVLILYMLVLILQSSTFWGNLTNCICFSWIKTTGTLILCVLICLYDKNQQFSGWPNDVPVKIKSAYNYKNSPERTLKATFTLLTLVGMFWIACCGYMHAEVTADCRNYQQRNNQSLQSPTLNYTFLLPKTKILPMYDLYTQLNYTDGLKT